MRWIAGALALIWVGVASGQQIYRCADAAGGKVYQSMPCDGELVEADKPVGTPKPRAAPVPKADDTPLPDGAVRIKGEHWFGCRTEDAYKRLVSLASDVEAFREYLVITVAAGECRAIPQRSGVFLERSALFSGMVRVRPVGSSMSLWTSREAVSE